MAQGKIFLDTTVVADRVLAKDTKQGQIQSNLEHAELHTAAYVVGEIKQTFIKDAILLYKLVYNTPNLKQASLRFQDHFMTRVESRLQKLFSNLLEDEPISKELVLLRMEIWLEGVLEDRLLEGIETPYHDKCTCSKATSTPTKQGDIWTIDLKCPKTGQATCTVWTVIDANKEFFTSVLANNVLGEEKSSRVKSLLNERPTPLGDKCRWLGDALITLECPDDAQLYTTNTKDFGPLVGLAGRKLFP